jgi:hypothetical protein
MSQVEELYKRSQQSKRNYYNPNHPDYGLNPVQKQKRHAQVEEDRRRAENPPLVTEEDKRIPMEEAGCFFYPDKLAIGPMHSDGTPDLHDGVIIDAHDIDMADMGEFSQENFTLIIQTIRRSNNETD